MNNISYLWITLIGLCLACTNKSNTPTKDQCAQLTANQQIKPASVGIVSYSSVGTLSVDQIKKNYEAFLTRTKATSAEITKELARVKYEVNFLRVNYYAVDPFGETKLLSGLVTYPKFPEVEQSKKVSIIALNHGTLNLQTLAPSNADLSKDASRAILGGVAPSFEGGYLVAQPDYFGYGIDELNMHYYEHAESLAEACRKLVEAMPSLSEIKKINLNMETLYLCGYSEGGGATLAALKSFSENPSDLFKNYVTIAGAGAYDKPEFTSLILDPAKNQNVKFFSSYAWVIMTYNQVYKLNKSVDEMFKPTIAAEMQTFIGNDLIIESHIFPDKPSDVFNSPFAENASNGTDVGFAEALAKNNISDFKGIGDITLFTSNADILVLPINTHVTFDRLKKQGCNVALVTVEGLQHFDAFDPYLKLVMAKLK